ncbi:hypothetical protein ABD624_08185 [Avibacterium paragallinarum]
MEIQKEREAFEAWFDSRYDAYFMQFALDLDMYIDKHTQTCWEAWQAAKAQTVPEWFDYTKQSPQMDGNYQIFIKGEQITAKWVSRFGFADPIEGDALRQELITHWAMQPQSPKAQEPAND